MVFTSSDIPDQGGRVAIVTGGTAGIGYESVLALARKGALVIFTARSTARGEETLEKIKAALALHPSKWNMPWRTMKTSRAFRPSPSHFSPATFRFTSCF
ncbi:unnamed protein product [Aphanomyces euteiches]